MKITKYETNIRRNLFLKETSNITFSKDIKQEENKLINLYPFIEMQEFLGFGGALTRLYLL